VTHQVGTVIADAIRNGDIHLNHSDEVVLMGWADDPIVFSGICWVGFWPVRAQRSDATRLGVWSVKLIVPATKRWRLKCISCSKPISYPTLQMPNRFSANTVICGSATVPLKGLSSRAYRRHMTLTGEFSILDHFCPNRSFQPLTTYYTFAVSDKVEPIEC